MSPSSFDPLRSPRSPRTTTAGRPSLDRIMMEEPPRSPVRRRILLMSVVLTLSGLALSITRSSRVYLFEQAQCLLYYQSNGETQVDRRDSIEEGLCKRDEIQYPLSVVVGIDTFLSLLPAILILPTFERLLSTKSLRYLLLVNLSCSILGVLFSIVVFWLRQPWATYIAPLAWAFDLVGGGEMVRLTVIPTCIAAISDPDKLTTTYNYMSGAYLLAGVGGAAFGSLLLSDHVYLLNFLSVLCFASTAFLAMSIPDDCGRDLKATDGPVSILSTDEEDLTLSPPLLGQRELSEARTPLSLLRILVESWQASYHALWKLFQVPNPTFTVVLIILANSLAMNVQVLLPQYTSLALQWTFASVNAALALKTFVSTAVLFSLPTIRKTFLEPRMDAPHIDLLITQLSIIANLVGMAGLGVSSSVGLFLFFLCVSTSGAGLVDSLYGYGTIILPHGEQITELYLRFGLVQTIAGLTGAPLWSIIFSFVLKSRYLPFALPFWLGAGLYGGALVGAGALKRWHGMRA